MLAGESNNNIRWKIALLICVASALNYMDRNILAILAPVIQKDLNWTDADYAGITSLFVLSYTFMYAISGGIVDRIGTKWGMPLRLEAGLLSVFYMHLPNRLLIFHC